MEPTDIARIITVSDAVISPDALSVAFVVSRIDLDANRYRSSIWVAAADGSADPLPLTSGDEEDRCPAWSPDSRSLAFNRSRRGDPASHSLHVIAVDGPGEVRTLAEGPESYSSLDWSPDGRHITGSVRVRSDRYDAEKESVRPPRRIDGLRSRLDNEGWTVDRRRQIFVVAADGLSPLRTVTSGPYDHNEPRWNPLGDRLVFVSAQHEGWDLGIASDLFVLDPFARQPEPVRLTTSTHDIRSPAWSPDGERIAMVATECETLPRLSHISVVGARGGEPMPITTALDRECSPTSGAVQPAWIDNGRALLFAYDDHGNVPLARVEIDGLSAPTPVLTAERWVTSFTVARDRIAFTASGTTSPLELFVAALDGTGERQLSRVQDAFVDACPPIDAQRFPVASPAGDGDLDAWLMRPPSFDAAGSYPALLIVHGGPMTQYGNRFFDEVQIYASAGYVVVFTNPHGSTGDGESFLRSIRSPLAEVDPGTGWGGIDFDDLLAVLDAALAAEPAMDAGRVGIIGGSYGGFMASWAIGHTNRFAAACSERAVNNMLSLEWTSDIAGTFRLEAGIDPIEMGHEMLRQSPISYVREIETPVLILHSEGDLRCPVEQADQLFTQLRLLGKPCEYHRFDSEGHEMSRSGSPAHRIQRAEIILDFFARHLHPRTAQVRTG